MIIANPEIGFKRETWTYWSATSTN